jgi:hypothetical protein
MIGAKMGYKVVEIDQSHDGLMKTIFYHFSFA